MLTTMCIYKRFSFQDEYRQFLLSYGVEYDEAYVLIKAFALTGRGDSTMWKTQGVASLALGILCSWPNFTLFFYVNKSIAKSITRIWPLVVLA